MIVGIGTVVVDHVVELDAFPEVDRKTAIRHHWRQVGGPVPTALVTAARLGSSCGFIGKWGADVEGDFIEADLRGEGLDLDQSVRDPEGESGFAHVWVDAGTGTRNIAFSRGRFEALGACELPLHADLLHVDGAHGDAAVAAARQARERGATVVLDAGSMKPRTEALFPLADVVVGSSQFFQSVTGSADPAVAGPALLEWGVRQMVLTKGREGAWIVSSNGLEHIPAFEIEAVDTTGAGDVFCGGLIHALVRKLPLTTAVLIGAAAAGWKCQFHGNRASLPSPEDLLSVLRANQRGDWITIRSLK